MSHDDNGRPLPPMGRPMDETPEPRAAAQAAPSEQPASPEAPGTPAPEASCDHGPASSGPAAAPGCASGAAPAAQHASCPPGRHRARAGLIVTGCSVVALCLGLGVGYGVSRFAQPAASDAPRPTYDIQVKGENPNLAEVVAAKCLPSVVAIDVYAPSQSGNGLFVGPGSGQGELKLASLGSGVFISKDGYIVTNNHVVADGRRFTVTTNDGKRLEAKFVGSDPTSDLAVLKVDGKDFPAIETANSDELRVGEWVMTIGSPYGLEQSVATGIVSAVNRSTALANRGQASFYTNMIQTDAAINPGNSGGALVDDKGKLIGINTIITSPSGSYSGVGFAIPVNYAMSVAKDLIEGKQPTHAQIGVIGRNIDAEMASYLGIKEGAGIYVVRVIEGSPAQNAGIVPGDVIQSIDGKEVHSVSELVLAIRSKSPGEEVTVKYLRDKTEHEAKFALGDDSASAN